MREERVWTSERFVKSRKDEKKRKTHLFSFSSFLAISVPNARRTLQRTSLAPLVPATMRPHALLRSRVLLRTTARINTRRCRPSFCNASDDRRAASTSSSDPPPPALPQQQYSYVDAAGKRKATLQDAAPNLTSSEARAPWELGFQVPERSASLWGDDLRRRLIRHALAARFGNNSNSTGEDSPLVLSEAEIDERLAQLARLLPGLAPRLATTSASLLAEMVADPAAVAATLVGLRATFPGADVGRMVARSPQLALAGGRRRKGGKGSGGGSDSIEEEEEKTGLEALAEARAALSALLPNLDVDGAVSEHPSLLDARGVALAIDEARRVLGPSRFELAAFEREPSLVFRFQHGDLLIPYDQFEKNGS